MNTRPSNERLAPMAPPPPPMENEGSGKHYSLCIRPYYVEFNLLHFQCFLNAGGRGAWSGKVTVYPAYSKDQSKAWNIYCISSSFSSRSSSMSLIKFTVLGGASHCCCRRWWRWGGPLDDAESASPGIWASPTWQVKVPPKQHAPSHQPQWHSPQHRGYSKRGVLLGEKTQALPPPPSPQQCKWLQIQRRGVA